MSIKYYTEVVSPFVQTKVLLHKEKLLDIYDNPIVAPVTCEIDLTDGFCNNKCQHCFFATAEKSNPIYLDFAVVKELLTELKKIGTKAIELSGGGEPTTHPYISEIIDFAHSIGLEVGLVTNGLLMNKVFGVINKLKYIRISLDAGSPETYSVVHGIDSFDTVIENIKRAVELSESKEIGIGYLILPYNLDDISKAAKIAKEIGVRFIQYRPASLEYDTDREIWIRANELVKKTVENYIDDELQVFDAGIKWLHMNDDRKYSKCLTSSIVAVVKANGDIPLCVLKRNHNDEIIGNINNGGFIKSWYSEKHLNLINNINVKLCRKPCKHDSYNIACEAIHDDLYHSNFI